MDADNKKMYTSEKREITKLNRIKFLYVTLPIILIFALYFFGNNIITFNIYKFFTLFIFGFIWVLWVSFGSIIINRYVFIDVPEYDINDNTERGKKKKNHPWFKMPMIMQLFDLVSNLSLIIVLFVLLQYIFKKVFLSETVSEKSQFVSSYFIKFMTKVYLFLTTGKFEICKDRLEKNCKKTFLCKFRDGECLKRNNLEMYEYSKYVSININILNAFLTVYFQTSIKNKLQYFIKKYLSNKNNLLYVPNF